MSALYLCKHYNMRPFSTKFIIPPDLCTRPQRDSARSRGNESIFTILGCDTAITESWKTAWDGFPTSSDGKHIEMAYKLCTA